MSGQEHRNGQTFSAEDLGDKEAEFFIIETDFIVQDIGLSSNIPHEIDALAMVNNESGVLTLLAPHDNVGGVVRGLAEMGIGITGANFDLAPYRENGS